ncbi:MAG: hypothetical protein K0R61_368 [Microvirga sp.]|jgi:hypothetical protein|nr:hypothetical protein [Microvirga sp.]MCD6069806.1 hypothetical protein [Microvirga sp.]MDF2687095.1 hypothetical protein [Microvirga sp.]MDF2969918.1 hypothetical protein [Microvirga sp.]
MTGILYIGKDNVDMLIQPLMRHGVKIRSLP